MKIETVCSLNLAETRVVGVDEGDQSVTLATPGGFTFKVPEAAWSDLLATEALVVISEPEEAPTEPQEAPVKKKR